MKTLAILILVLSLLGLLFFAIGYASDQAGDAQYRQAQGDALIIRAEAESRLATATANAITTSALLPWGVLAILGTLGLAIVSLSGAIVVTRPRQQPPQIIERQIVYLPAPGQRRGETWKALVSGGDVIQVETSQQSRFIEVS